mmetsp:Transcript_47924/g.35136  ORF Transcript_47924/g.35136 Transcript_47924/m.35136 type:complete len:128 (+) Transcript_47924:129-512(+)
MDEKLTEWASKYEEPGEWMDLMQEINDIHMRIILRCAFGVDAHLVMVDQWQNGKQYQKPLGQALKDVFNQFNMRTFRWETLVNPFLCLVYNRRSDRELLKNVEAIRKYARHLIAERKVEMQADSSVV